MRLYQTAATGDNIMWLNFIYAVCWSDEHCDILWFLWLWKTDNSLLNSACSPERAQYYNIQKPCSNPPGTKTCFVRSTVLASIFQSTQSHLKTLRPVACTASVYFEGKPSAWTDPNLKLGRFSLSHGKQTSEWRLSHGAPSSCQIGCMNALLLRLLVYGPMGW
jgi:hypothetical protein